MEVSNERENNNEEIIIENRYNVTKELYVKWAKENKTSTYFKIFWIGLAIFSMVFAIICIISNYAIYGGIFFICAINGLYRGIFRKSLLLAKSYKAFEKLYKKSNWERRIQFFNDYIETSEANMNILRFQYKDITEFKMDDECIKLRINNGGYIRVYNDAFTKSNLEECKKFLNKKLSNIK